MPSNPIAPVRFVIVTCPCSILNCSLPLCSVINNSLGTEASSSFNLYVSLKINRFEAPNFHFGAGLSRLTTDEKLQGAFAPFGRLLEGTKRSSSSNVHASVLPFPSLVIVVCCHFLVQQKS